MNILKRLFNKKKHISCPTEVGKSSNKFRIVVDSAEYDLSEEQQETIVSIVQNGLSSNNNLEDIAIDVMISVDIYGPIIINRFDNSVEVIIC